MRPTYMGMQMLPSDGLPYDRVVMFNPRNYGKAAAQRAAMLGYGFGMGKDKLAEYAKKDADMAMYGDGLATLAAVQHQFNKAVNWPLHYDNNEGDNDNL